MRAHVFAMGALLAVGLAVGCATGGQEPGSGPDPLAMPAPAAEPVLHVNNRNWQDVDVFAVRLGSRLRLGSVGAMAARDFKLPSIFGVGGGDFQVMVAPVGESRGFMTETLLLNAGQTLELQIENNLSLSTFSVH